MVADTLRPLSVGETLDHAFGLYRRHLGALVTIVVVVESVPLLLGVYVESAGGLIAVPYLGIFSILLNYVLHSVATGASIFVISESYLGHTISPGEALRRALPFLWRLLALSLLAGLAFATGTFGGAVLLALAGSLIGLLIGIPTEAALIGTLAGFFLAGAMMMAGLSVATQALVLEPERGPIQALGRSWELTRLRRPQMFALFLVPLILVSLPMIALLFLSFFYPDPLILAEGERTVTPLGVMAIALASIAQLLLYPLLYSVLTVAYYDLRVRREGFDLDLLAEALQAS